MSPLIEAVKASNISKVRELVANESSQNERIWALFYAVEKKYPDIDIVKILIGTGVDVNQERLIMMGQAKNLVLIEGTVLREAVFEGHLEIVRLLLEAGADVNLAPRRNTDEPTALMLAAQEGCFEITKLLVKAGADVNIIRDGSSYALLSAASEGYKDIFDFLYPLTNPELRPEALEALPKGMQMRQIEDEADPLVCQITSAIMDEDIDTVREILKTGVNINGFDDIGATALGFAVIKGSVELVQLLLESGANPNLGSADDQETPLMQLGRIGGWRETVLTICYLLLKAGANVNARDEEGSTPLMFAVQETSAMPEIEIHAMQGIQKLLEAGAEVNTQNNEGMTALMLAAKFGKVQIIRILTEAKAEINLKEKKGKTALDYAREKTYQYDFSDEGVDYNESIKILEDWDKDSEN